MKALILRTRHGASKYGYWDQKLVSSHQTVYGQAKILKSRTTEDSCLGIQKWVKIKRFLLRLM